MRIWRFKAYPFASRKTARFLRKSFSMDDKIMGPPKISRIPIKIENTVQKDIPDRLFAINAKALPIAAMPMPPPISIMGLDALPAGAAAGAAAGAGTGTI